MESPPPIQHDILNKIHTTLLSIQEDYKHLSATVGSIEGRLKLLDGKQVAHQTAENSIRSNLEPLVSNQAVSGKEQSSPAVNGTESSVSTSASPIPKSSDEPSTLEVSRPSSRISAPATSSRIILTTYPGQSGIDPLPIYWGHSDPIKRGPVVVSRGQSTFRRRNAIGAHGGSYSIYHALAVASKDLNVDHKPDFTDTEPAVVVGPFPQWADGKRIVSMDPLGHLAPWLYADTIRNENVHIRPTIAITKAHMKLPELEQSVRSGRIVADGKICLNSSGELAVTKFAVEPVWYLPGVAERFGIGRWIEKAGSLMSDEVVLID
ncbi:MAG: hypothetical protein Q9190_002219 [Brigantiaea leucoxantha]